MRFTKYNNPSKKRKHRYISRTDADIIAAKAAFEDRVKGIELPLGYYDSMSDQLSNKDSRDIY